MFLYMRKAQESRSGPDRQAQVISKYELKLEKKTLNFSPSESINGEISLALAAGHAMKALKLVLIGSEKINWFDEKESTAKRFLSNETLAKSIPGIPGKLKFKLKLPPNLPPSYLGKHGSIQYWIEPVFGEGILAALATSTRFEGKMQPKERNQLLKKYRKFIKVQPFLDLTAIPSLFSPLTTKVDNSGIFHYKNLIEVIASLGKTGFVAGESIPYSVHIINGSDKFITSSRIALVQESKFCAGPVNRGELKICFEAPGPTLTTKCCQVWEGSVTIPSSLSQITIKGSFISVDYSLRITVTSSGFMESVETSLPLVLGTVKTGSPACPETGRRVCSSSSSQSLVSELSYCSHGYLERAAIQDEEENVVAE